MNFPIVPEHRTDIENINTENRVRGEPFKMSPGVFSRIVVPVHSPFFVKSLRVYNANMEPLGKDDWRIYKIMGGLTELTAKPVSCMIEFTNPDITSGFIDYDIVGHFSLFDATFLKLVIDMTNDDRPVWWDNLTNKPKVFRPILHGHSLLRDIVAFKDTVEILNLLFKLMTDNARTALQVKFDHYLDLLNHYIGVYKTEILANLERHKSAYDSHGFTKTQAGLSLVDNYPTAIGDDTLRPRSDRHLTPSGLRTIIDTFGFNGTELLESNKLPISQFGNSNFIPPSIDGSFEGLGGSQETAGITMESDGSLVFLENRMDGRIRGLYYSVIQSPYSSPRRVYTGYKYVHQRLEADAINADRIVQGSGADIIMVGDSVKDEWYIGLTNGSMNPERHVYSKINLAALKTIITGGIPSLSGYADSFSIVAMGAYIYVIFANSFANGAYDPVMNDRRHRYIFRVNRADVAAQRDVTAVKINVTFVDGDGVQWNNAPFWRFSTPVPNANFPADGYRKVYHTFVQDKVAAAGMYRSPLSFACPIPSKPGKSLLRFCSAWWANYTAPGISGTYQSMIEMLYEFDPETNIMTLVSKTPPKLVDFANLPDPGWNMINLVFADSCQGGVVLEDGAIVVSIGSYQSFPRSAQIWKPANTNTLYSTMSKQWNTDVGPFSFIAIPGEVIVSPLKSSIKPRAFMLGNGYDIYTAGTASNSATNGLYMRMAPGKLAIRPTVQNIHYPDLWSRPLNNDVRELRVDPRMGGASVTVPTAQLDSFGTDLGDSTFCFNVQKQFYVIPPAWPQQANLDDVLLISDFTTQPGPDGIYDVTPTGTIVYPQAIVNQLKTEVASVPIMQSSPKVFVQICDPTGRLTNRFGWLPILVCINYVDITQNARYHTLLSIQPVYSGPANARVVTGYTVLDRVHILSVGVATGVAPGYWDAYVGGGGNAGTHSAPRVGYHVNGNNISGFLDTGLIASGPGDSYTSYFLFRYDNKTTRRWNYADGNITGNSGSGLHKCVAPDVGVVTALAYVSSTGGAATLFQGGGKNFLLGSTYPETGWTIFAQSEIKVTFNGKPFTIPPGSMDLRDVSPDPKNKTFYVYAVLRDGAPVYEVGLDKRLESPFQVWVAKAITNNTQILTIERFNVFTLNGNRVSEIKRGNCIPASSGLANAEGQIPWLRDDELLP